jgi:hypothetical protein
MIRGAVPIWLDAGLELFVGVMLVVLGARALLHGRALQSGNLESHSHRRWGPFAVGLGHGVAGTGGAVLLATATMPNIGMGVVFLGLFGLGSIVGMAFIAGSLSLPMQRVASATGRHGQMLQAAGVLSAAIGLWWIGASVVSLMPT